MNWKGLLGSAMPMLAEIIPGGKLVGLALKAVTSALGLPESSDEETIAAALKSATPEQRVAMRLADQDHVLNVLRETNRAKEVAEKIITEDRANARNMAMMEVSKDQSPWWAPTRRTWLAGAAIIGFMSSLAGLFYISQSAVPIDPGAKDILVYGLGCLTTVVISVYSFDFGSTQGSQRKDDVIARSQFPG